MNIEELREYCLSIKNAAEYMPFEDEYLIFKVFEKWFAVIPLNDYELNISVNAIRLQPLNYANSIIAWSRLGILIKNIGIVSLLIVI